MNNNNNNNNKSDNKLKTLEKLTTTFLDLEHFSKSKQPKVNTEKYPAIILCFFPISKTTISFQIEKRKQLKQKTCSKVVLKEINPILHLNSLISTKLQQFFPSEKFVRTAENRKVEINKNQVKFNSMQTASATTTSTTTTTRNSSKTSTTTKPTTAAKASTTTPTTRRRTRTKF